MIDWGGAIKTKMKLAFDLSWTHLRGRDILNVVDYLVPKLQRRGGFRTKYESRMLKDNLAIAA